MARGRSAESGRPHRYAAEKLPIMLQRWQSEAGDAVRRMGPAIFPGAPPQALLAVTANSMGPHERYCEGFCAVGLYQIPESTWHRLRTHPDVVRLLGRPAPEDWQASVSAQVATGLVSLREDLHQVARQVGWDLIGEANTPWAYAVAIMGYVVGPSGAARILQRFAPQLREVSAHRRFAKLIELTATEGRRDSAYPVLRAWQRFETGRLLAARTGGDLQWFSAGLPDPGGEEGIALASLTYGGYAGEPETTRQGNGNELAAILALTALIVGVAMLSPDR